MLERQGRGTDRPRALVGRERHSFYVEGTSDRHHRAARRGRHRCDFRPYLQHQPPDEAASQKFPEPNAANDAESARSAVERQLAPPCTGEVRDLHGGRCCAKRFHPRREIRRLRKGAAEVQPTTRGHQVSPSLLHGSSKNDDTSENTVAADYRGGNLFGQAILTAHYGRGASQVRSGCFHGHRQRRCFRRDDAQIEWCARHAVSERVRGRPGSRHRPLASVQLPHSIPALRQRSRDRRVAGHGRDIVSRSGHSSGNDTSDSPTADDDDSRLTLAHWRTRGCHVGREAFNSRRHQRGHDDRRHNDKRRMTPIEFANMKGTTGGLPGLQPNAL